MVGEANKDALVIAMTEALERARVDGSLLVAGVEGIDRVRVVVVDPTLGEYLARWQGDSDALGFFDGLLGRVCVLAREWVRTNGVSGLATLETVGASLGLARQMLEQLDGLPGRTADAVVDRLRPVPVGPVRVEVGTVPPAPPG